MRERAGPGDGRQQRDWPNNDPYGLKIRGNAHHIQNSVKIIGFPHRI